MAAVGSDDQSRAVAGRGGRDAATRTRSAAADTRAQGESPWRPVIEEIGRTVAGRRDEIATIGSINWLRHAMDAAGANANVVRNIIYRDKGRLHDKRALYLILVGLRKELGLAPIEDPALTLLASPYAAAELEVSQVLGREQRRVYRTFVGGVRSGTWPKTLVTGKPGSGKTMLADYVQHGLEAEPRAVDTVVRYDFTDPDLTAGLARFAVLLGVTASVVESRLARIGAASSFAVQADSQAEVARVILESQRHRQGSLAVLLHLSRALSAQGTLGNVPLRLNTPEVPRVSAADWLWHTLLRPLATTGAVSAMVSSSTVPAGAVESPLPFDAPTHLAQPTTAEARRYVRSLAPQLDDRVHEETVRRAGRSYEELRTLTLLAQARSSAHDTGDDALDELAALVTDAADPGLRSFLAAVAVLSAGDGPGFATGQLATLRGGRRAGFTALEASFLDPLPGSEGSFRCFSRSLARSMYDRLVATSPTVVASMHLAAAALDKEAAHHEPGGVAAAEHLHHVYAGRDWEAMLAWMADRVVPFPLLMRVWATARDEADDRDLLERIALEVARHLLRLGADQHVELVRAFELLAASEHADMRAWAAVLRAQLEVSAGHFERAAVLLDVSPGATEPLLAAEQRLTRASVLRWRGELEAAEAIVAELGYELQRFGPAPATHAARAVLAKTAVWAGLIAKDRGDLHGAIEAMRVGFDSDELLRARLAFQRGDVLLRLGLFDAASREFESAINAAGRSGALAQERARLLARRGSLRRLMGDVVGARSDLGAARQALLDSELAGLDLDFALARVADEGSYTHLASGAFEEAIVANTTALATFREYQRRRDVDAGFRIARSSLRLAVAYAFRGFALPFKRPLPAFRPDGTGPDLRHATAAMDALIAKLTGPGSRVVASASAVGGLLAEARLLTSLVSPDGAHALRHADAALAAADYPYQRARAEAARAGALLALGRPDAALDAVERGEDDLETSRTAHFEDERGDLSLVAQFAVYRAGAHLAAGAQADSAEAIWRALSDPRLEPFQEPALRAFGEAAEVLGHDGAWKRHRHLRTLLGVNGTGPSTPARLPDALVAAWRSRAAAV